VEEKTISSIPDSRRFRPYPSYKDSGVEWLGKIPENWKVRPLKYIAPLITDRIDGIALEIPYVGLEHIESRTGKMVRAAEYGPSVEQVAEGLDTRFRSGDVLFGKLRPYLAKVLLSSFDGRCSSEFLVLRSGGEISPAFLGYQLLSPGFIAWINAMTYGTKMPRASPDQVMSMPITIPDADEQSAISAFLDRETAKIDALIEKKEGLIELLQEKRSALIAQAVTKGLDQTVPMKDSGVEWLGKIPTHWEVVSLKRRTKRIQTGTTPPTGETKYYEDGIIPWYGPGSFAEDLPLQEPVKFISDSAFRDGVARVFEAYSSMIVTIGATIGKVAFMEHTGSCNQQITGVTFDFQQVFPKYGAYQLKSLERVLRGIAPNTTLPIIDQEEVGYLPFIVPPAPEQEPIAAFLDGETAMIDSLVAKVQEAVNRLNEYRTTLISAAVTGKINVQSSLP